MAPQLRLEFVPVHAGDLARVVDELGIHLQELRADVRRQSAACLGRTGGANGSAETSDSGPLPVEAAKDPGVQCRDAVVGQRDLDRQATEPILEADTLDGTFKSDGCTHQGRHQAVDQERRYDASKGSGADSEALHGIEATEV